MYKIFADYLARRSASILFTDFRLFDIISSKNNFGIGGMYSILCACLLEGCAEGWNYFKVDEMKNINFQNLEIFPVECKRSFTFSKYENIFI